MVTPFPTPAPAPLPPPGLRNTVQIFISRYLFKWDFITYFFVELYIRKLALNICWFCFRLLYFSNALASLHFWPETSALRGSFPAPLFITEKMLTNLLDCTALRLSAVSCFHSCSLVPNISPRSKNDETTIFSERTWWLWTWVFETEQYFLFHNL